ncbi:hypothetical protein [Rathayibacter sp. VKM Ac-2760]|uniref:hypothetical protein n=1 Tax=Rathayibacter sp. VKM Ac-2760 TaxID=2609253 RepID=UPI001316F616|nr:hypothetical protein [Rathayibacter sp. VKM Ac-2760]QHC58865.1 hypothetical protein GSU72_10135 [Rathayibacter sp. VKM Ac-2760]
MSAAADVLLSGPRGRRLCWECATEAEGELRSAAFLLAHAWEGRGESVLLYASADGADPRDRPDPTPESVAALITALPPTPAEDDAVRAALRRSVDTAYSWQEPDAADVLAALPELREALLPVAERVFASPAAATWSRPATPTQWAVDWRPDTARPLPTGTAALLAEWSTARRADEEQSARERPSDPRASYSGSWWSLPLRLPRTQSRIEDLLELVEDSAGLEAATVIPVTSAGRTREIGSADDWADLCRAYPAEVTASRRHDWYRVTGGEGRWLIPDWQRVAADWDAVHLTTLGYLSSATRLIPVDDGYDSVLAGWAPDSTLWLTDAAKEADGPRQQWRRTDRDRWERTG